MTYFEAAVDRRCNFNMQAVLQIRRGVADVQLRRALLDLVRRHEALRTTLQWSGGRLEQLVWAPSPPPIRYQTLESPADIDAALVQSADEQIDLVGGPLIRVDVLVVGDALHVVALTMSHIISDLHSCEFLKAELAELYAAHLSETPPSLPPVTVQPRHRMEREDRPPSARTAAYWRDYLGARKPSASVAVPLHPCPGAIIQAIEFPVLPAEAVGGLNRLAVAARTVLPVALLAVLAAEFHSSDAGELRVLFTHANRYAPKDAGIVGLLADVFPIRIRLSGEQTFRELLTNVHRDWIGALAHRCSLRQILSAVEGGSSDEPPRYDLQFNYLSKPSSPVGDGLDVGSLGIEPLEVPFGARRIRSGKVELMPLGYWCRRVPSGAVHALACLLTGPLSASENAIVARLDLGSVLARVIAAPDTRLGELVM